MGTGVVDSETPPPAAGGGSSEEDSGTAESKSNDEGEGDGESGAVKGAGLSDKTIASARTLDRVIAEMSKNFAEGTDYFKILVKVFQEVIAKVTMV